MNNKTTFCSKMFECGFQDALLSLIFLISTKHDLLSSSIVASKFEGWKERHFYGWLRGILSLELLVWVVLSKAAFIFESFFERSMKFVVFLQKTIRLREKALMVAPQSWRQGSKAALSKIQAKMWFSGQKLGQIFRENTESRKTLVTIRQ